MAEKYGLSFVSDRVAKLQSAGVADDAIEKELASMGWTVPAYVQAVQLANGDAPAAPTPPAPMSQAEGVLGGISQGASLGFGDEINGALWAAMRKAKGDPRGIGDLYRTGQQGYDQSQRAFDAANPVTAGFANAGGSIVPGLATAGAPVAQGVMRAAAGPLERILAAAGFSGLIGGAAGAGAADPGAGNIAAGAGDAGTTSAALGAVLGGAAEAYPGLKDGVKGLAAYVQRVVGIAPETAGAASGGAIGGGPVGRPTPPNMSGAGKVLEAIQRDQMTPGGIMGSLQAARAGGNPMSIVEAGGPNVRGLGQAVATLPGPGQTYARAGLDPRAQPSAQRGRIEGQLERLAGQPIPTAEQIAAQEQAARGRRGEDYRRAYSMGAIDDPTGTQGHPALVAQLESRPIYAEAHNAEVQATARTERMEGRVPPLFDEQGRVTRPPTVQDIDAIKKRLDTEVYGAQGLLTPDSAVAKANVSRVEGARQELLKETDPRAPLYAKTRAEAGTDFEMVKAAELAQDITRLSPQEVRAFMATASEAGKQAFRANALMAYRAQMLKSSDKSTAPALVREVFGTGDGGKRAVIRELFSGDEEALAAFEASMRRELESVAARNHVFGGSNTMNKAGAMADLQGGDAGDIAAGAVDMALHPAAGSLSLTRRLLSGAAARGQSSTWAGKRGEIASNIFSDSATITDDFLRALEEVRLAREAAMRNSPNVGAAVVSGTVSRQGD
jgi:hypothetical protein